MVALEDWILANAREFVEGMAAAERVYAAGKTANLDDLIDELSASKSLARFSSRSRWTSWPG